MTQTLSLSVMMLGLSFFSSTLQLVFRAMTHQLETEEGKELESLLSSRDTKGEREEEEEE